jgi:hypothetical protein
MLQALEVSCAKFRKVIAQVGDQTRSSPDLWLMTTIETIGSGCRWHVAEKEAVETEDLAFCNEERKDCYCFVADIWTVHFSPYDTIDILFVLSVCRRYQ